MDSKHDHHHDHDHHGHGHDHHADGAQCSCGHDEKAEDVVVRDAVCGMTVAPKAGKPSLDYQGHTYHFCSDGCRKKFEAAPQDYLTARDPVCGMTVNRSNAKHFLKHEGEKFYFCSAGCKAKFETDPETYRHGKKPAAAAMPKGTLYTCPMHPEVVSDRPATARNVAWRWSRWAFHLKTKVRIRNSWILSGVYGSVLSFQFLS